MERKHKEIFLRYLPNFLDQVDPQQLLTYLPCLSKSSRDTVDTAQRSVSRSYAAQVLHSHLERRPEGFRQLVLALRHVNVDCTELADLLDPQHCYDPSNEDEVLRSKDSQEDAILDDIDLTKLLLKEGRTSREVFKECQKICQAIKDESEHIVHVEAAYRFGDDKHVIFLVFAAKNIQINVIWETEIRIINNYSDESSVMLHCKENSPLTEKESQKIGEIIDMHSKKLMSNHKFLSAISASSVSSRCFGPMRLKHVIEKRPCIVLNVLVKGIIPLNEEYFPTKLEGTPVDVREGGVRLCVNKAEEYQENVTMGCKITSSTCPVKAGTLGGFIEHPEYGLCGITCAHVIMNDADKFKLKEMSTITVKEKLDGMMYQPDVRIPDNKLGKLVQVIYREGENGKPGVDLALFRIETRAPKQGRFPDNTLPSFNEGLVWGKTGIPDGHTEVRKFGYVTLNTSGVMQFDNCAIREEPFHSNMTMGDGTPFTTTLYKQYHIKSCDKNIPFCKLGDSGALVFMEDNTGEETTPRCIGMVVAVTSGNSGYVTPINAILDELKVKQFKPFTTHSATHALLQQVSGMLKSHFDGVNERLEKLEERISRIEADNNKT
ncbi:uncharacterized protein LOC132750552 isoform X2 [Ruditapes philippinarum]|uniref:uncharacterized protein LOC132750552 isoform X2 n=1 Tax=Ruditapes philippinarum TaxID=129788 RepID=UPI00295BFB01|nr:uncharacterized protein LOC132750552 isoform X2 [Ruditapes philippinarum]